MATIRLPNNWAPRPYQLPAWQAWEAGCKRDMLVWHRRAGKDDYALHKAAVAAHQRVANYWHCLPMYEQARKAIWEAINPHTGKRRIDEAFPLEIRKRTDSQSMTIELKVGSIWKVVGSDNPNSLVGAPPAGIVFSEWALANPSAWAYLAPILEENGGWATFITTPRGRNHAHTMFNMARMSPDWFAEKLTIEDTAAISEAAVEKQRTEYHAIFGPDAGDALIQQEYYCSFEAAILGAYYGREMLEVEQSGRIAPVPILDDVPVQSAWDLGVGDATAIWCFQAVGRDVRVVDYYQATGYGASHYVDWLNERGYRGTDWVPHDAKNKEWTSSDEAGFAKSRIQDLLAMGRKPKLVPRHKREDGINTARRLLGRCIFDPRTEQGLEALRQYRREWDDDKKRFKDTPLHDWASDGADAFRYLAMGYRQEVPDPVASPKLIHGVREMTFDQLIARQESMARREVW